MRSPFRLLLPAAATLAAASLASSAPAAPAAEGTPLHADLVESKSIKVDGVPKEWSGLQPLSTTRKGKAGKPDIEARAALTYDSTNLYVAADVTDNTLKGGGDHIELVIGFPGGAT